MFKHIRDGILIVPIFTMWYPFVKLFFILFFVNYQDKISFNFGEPQEKKLLERLGKADKMKRSSDDDKRKYNIYIFSTFFTDICYVCVFSRLLQVF